MNFNGSEGSFIEMGEGAKMTAAYREAQPGDNLCIFFGSEMLRELMEQDGAMGLRFYFAHSEGGKMALVTVAANAAGQDMLDRVGDAGIACPDKCCTDSPLGNAS